MIEKDTESDTPQSDADESIAGNSTPEQGAPNVSEPSAFQLIRQGLSKLKPKFRFDTFNMVLGGLGSFIVALIGLWISQEQSVDSAKILETILTKVETQGPELSSQTQQSFAAELEDFLETASNKEARLLEDAVSDDESRADRAFRELSNLAQDQVDAVEELEKKAARTYKTIGALSFWKNSEFSTKSFIASLKLNQDDLEARYWLAVLLKRRGDHQDASEQFEIMLDQAGVSDEKWQALALKGLGGINMDIGNFELANNQLNRSLAMFQESDDRRRVAGITEDLGILLSYLGDHDGARVRYLESLEIYNEINDQESAANAISNLGANAADRGEFELAVKYTQESLTLSKSLGLAALTARNLGNLANHERRNGNLQVAYDYASRSLAAYQELEIPEGVARLLGVIGVIHNDADEWEKAVGYADGSLKVYRALGNKRGMGLSYLKLGIFEENRGNQSMACQHWQDAETLFNEIGNNTLKNRVRGFQDDSCGVAN